MNSSEKRDLTNLLQNHGHVAWARLRELLLEAGLNPKETELTDYEPVELGVDRGTLQQGEKSFQFTFKYPNMNFAEASLELKPTPDMNS